MLSYCAMLSRRIYQKKEKRAEGKGDGDGGGGGGSGQTRPPLTTGVWEEPGNFNSNLSALTWTAQLVIFDYACFYSRDDDDAVPALLRRICQKFFQQLAETPFGYILQWRLYLFATSRNAIGKRQARWSLDGQTITFQGVELRMEQVTQLVASEYRQAHSLLYDELLLGTPGLAPIESWKLKDDLDGGGLRRLVAHRQPERRRAGRGRTRVATADLRQGRPPAGIPTG